jgi:hypothetical protein
VDAVPPARRAPDQLLTRPGRPTAPRRLHAEEDAPRRVLGTILVQVLGQRFADIRGNGVDRAETFAPHRDLADTPVEIGELQCRHLASAKAQTSEEEQHRAVPPTDGRRPIARVEQAVDLVRGEVFRQVRQAQLGTVGTQAARSRSISPRCRRNEDRAQRGHHDLRRPGLIVGA